jgi:DNA-binding GntR family transcriptional regulator
VREGLLLLQSESFVRLLPRRGFVVNGFSKEDLHDLFWAQATIGAELAGRAAKRMSRADVEQLQLVHAEYERAVAAGDAALRDRAGHQFHRLINLAAQSPRLTLLMGNLARQLPNRFYANIEGHLENTLEYHPIILDAIRVKDAEAVRSLMHRHIIWAAEQLVARLARAGLWGAAATDESTARAPRPAAKTARAPTQARRKPAGRGKTRTDKGRG